MSLLPFFGKRGLTTNAVRIATTLLLVTLIQGCSRTLQFRIIDAQRNSPLPGVVTTHRAMFSDIGGNDIDKRRILTTTGADGVVIARQVEHGLGHTFTFEKQGYQTAYASYSGSGEVGVYRNRHRGAPDEIQSVSTLIEVRMLPVAAAE